MENGSRVHEIRQRFEDITFQSKTANVIKQTKKPPLAVKPNHLLSNNSVQPATKCVIKRSHAFRSDKSKVKQYVISKDYSICDRKQLKIDSKLPPIYSKCLKNNKSTTTSSLTDTLKKALKAPLPSGPAPKKPPRTFVHHAVHNSVKNKIGLSSSSTASSSPQLPPSGMATKEKVDNQLQKSTPNGQNTTAPQLNNNECNNSVSNDKSTNHLSKSDGNMSKEKILSFIKNFENAIETQKVQNNNNNNNSGHIYDTPHDAADRSLNSSSNNVYSEPYSAQTKSEDSPKKINSLHYMSTPIENIKPENDGDGSPHLEYLIVPLNKESVEGRKEFDTVLRKTRKMLISNSDNDDFEEVYCDNSESPLADYYAMLPPRTKEQSSKNHDVFDEIKSLMIEAYNDGSVKFTDDGEQAQLRALRGDASSKQLTEMFTQIINDNDNRFRERCKSVRKKASIPPSEKLIDALLLVGIDTDLESNTKMPYVKDKHIQPYADIPSKVERLVFPDAEQWPPATSHTIIRHSNYFTIILTKNSGERSYAYCRRLMPEGSSFCLPLTYVILTGNEDSIFYHKVLDQVEKNHGLPENEYNRFVNDLLHSNFPKPGETLSLDDVQIERHEDNSQYEYVISDLLLDITIPVFLKLFAAMLLERKIIVVSSHVSKVCDSVEALCKCLYPFSWQHTIVSVLPSSMSEMLQCPPPYLVGLLKSKNHSNIQLENVLSGVDNVFAVDIDAGSIIKCVGDESSLIPKRLIKTLKSSLDVCPVRGPDTCASAMLLRLFVELVGHYPLVLINGPSGSSDRPGFRVFLRNSFVSALSSKSTEQFLRCFIDTAMFESFIRERLDNLDFKMGLFEKKCIEFIAEEVNKPSALLKRITLNRTVKMLGNHFLKEE